jgi:hypothetical protein
VVRRIFEMIGPEGKTINATRLALSRQGVPTAREHVPGLPRQSAITFSTTPTRPTITKRLRS